MRIGLFFICAALSAQSSLPEGKGREEFVNMCQSCHGLESSTNLRETKKGWERQVNEMLGRGAQGTDEQVNLVITYLAAHFGKPVNVNKASIKDLQEAFALPAKEAEAMVKYRQDNGDFKTLADVLKVPGVSTEKIQELSANIVF